MRSSFSGWTLTGVIAAFAIDEALQLNTWGVGSVVFLGGGMLAVSAGAWLSAKLRGRNARVDATTAATAYTVAGLLFLLLLLTRRGQDFPDFAIDAVVALLLFGFLFGFKTGAYYATHRPLVIAFAGAAIALWAGVMMFVLAYLLAGGNFLIVWGVVSREFKVPVGLLLSGLLGTFGPGLVMDSLLDHSRRTEDQLNSVRTESGGLEKTL